MFLIYYGGKPPNEIWTNSLLHLCASKMRMEPLLFADDRFAVTPQNGRFQREKV